MVCKKTKDKVRGPDSKEKHPGHCILFKANSDKMASDSKNSSLVVSDSIKIKEKQMIKYCFDCLKNHFDSSVQVADPDDSTECNGVFITWRTTIKEKENGDDKKALLRGCIGTFQHLPLFKALKIFSLKAALEDRRFEAINEKEIPFLTLSISILDERQVIKDHLDWEIGTHGLEMECDGYSATFLPEVMAEMRWGKEETIENLFVKSGYPLRYRQLQQLPRNFVLKKFKTKIISGGNC